VHQIRVADDAQNTAVRVRHRYSGDVFVQKQVRDCLDTSVRGYANDIRGHDVGGKHAEILAKWLR